ncbi:ABC transporter ATP-binding protein [Occultella aeris]|uniref:Daunorubicin/doxorubicin resistance ATP-binding protein DrrA n=1 Tax=Occultella aeris TaxID=2761496 RepID=A0A7M4DRL3_9MICO|nr:ABC transporter ATP-binding protein [Occultella aeris]VZO40107.1 Daunorubicin/doxorubicin resistance ATP-binding protein DrrA [Occultella aeris]
MIRARGLTKTFQRKKETVEAVKSIDVDVHEGELVAFLGPNGAGKSTTLRMLTSLLEPSSGTAEVAGWDVTADPAQVRARIGYIGQGNGGGYSYRVLDEVHNQGRFYGLPAEEYRRRTSDLLEALELTGLEKRTVQSLSGGQRRRLDVAMGLMNHPPLLFLDEPTTGLDPHSRANLWEHIGAMRQRYGMTIVLTTHYLDEADTMAERVVVIDHGTIIADAPPSVLKREYADDVITLTLASGGRAEEITALLAGAGGEVRTEPGPGAALVAVITTAHGSDRLPAAIEALRLAGHTVTSADLRRASLDDVFLNLTGRSLREEAA